MKFNCGRSWEEKAEAIMKWHRWFAWFPVTVGSKDCRWLEYVERRAFLLWDEVVWEYRK